MALPEEISWGFSRTSQPSANSAFLIHLFISL
jgi:hypothetical protein